jgi:hypothetical protein
MWENIMKMLATLGIWTITGAISFSATIDSPIDGDVLAVVIAPLLIALFATFFIWVAPELVRADRDAKSTHHHIGDSEKAKRRVSGDESRMALLMEMMDDDERQAFKETLKRRLLDDYRVNEDGELFADSTTLESLMQDEQRQRLRQ